VQLSSHQNIGVGEVLPARVLESLNFSVGAVPVVFDAIGNSPQLP